MNKLLTTLIALCFVGCVSGDVSNDFTKTTELDLTTQFPAAGVIVPDQSFSTSTTFDISDATKHFNDFGNTTLNVFENKLVAEGGTFWFANNISLSLQPKNGKLPELVICNKTLTSWEQNENTLFFNTNSDKLFDYLNAGELVLTVYFTGSLATNIPVKYENTLGITVDVSVRKSL